MANRSVRNRHKSPHALSCPSPAGGLDRGRRVVNDLLNHLVGQRAHLIAKMSNAHQRGGDVAGWLPLLAQTQAGIEAVEAATRESLTP